LFSSVGITQIQEYYVNNVTGLSQMVKFAYVVGNVVDVAVDLNVVAVAVVDLPTMTDIAERIQGSFDRKRLGLEALHLDWQTLECWCHYAEELVLGGVVPSLPSCSSFAYFELQASGRLY